MTPRPSESLPPYRLVATAGHVDHGKSTLVRALTGTDPDRLAEEKARGLTIDLGFASVELPSGAVLGVVDVPGHARFLKNMVAGVGSVDACVFVVAATEGWRAQSAEHLAVLDLFGIKSGVVALTKSDLVDQSQLEAVRAEVGERLVKSRLATAEVVPVDSVRGQGLGQLVSALEQIVATSEPAPDLGRPRLFVDRSFSLKGAGTVVTGTLVGGRVETGSFLALYPGAPPSFSPRTVRLRRLQVHGADRESARPGERVAANLTGVEAREVSRGQVLLDPAQWEPTRVIDVSLQLLETAPALGARGNRQFHFGTAHHPVRIRLLGTGEIPPGGSGLARLRLDTPLPLLPGDRFLLRDGGRAETIGGGEVLDISPVLPLKRARPDRSIERVVAERGFLEVGLLERLTGVRRPPDIGRYAVEAAERSRREAELRARLDAAGPIGLPAAELDDLDRAIAESLSGLRLEAGRYRRGERSSGAHPYVVASRRAPLAPPPLDGFSRAELRDLVRTGALVDCEGLFLLPEAIAAAKAVLAEELKGSEAEITVSAFRQRLSTSRRVAMALLAHFDATGFTRRRGDTRAAGPVLRRRLGLPELEESL